jgi:elongation factor Ts
VTVVHTADVPAEVLERERAIEMEKEDLKSKPEGIREKIVAGRVEKIAKEQALVEQAFIRDTSKTVAGQCLLVPRCPRAALRPAGSVLPALEPHPWAPCSPTHLLPAEHIKEQIATIGENIQVRRFERFVLGAGIEKKASPWVLEGQPRELQRCQQGSLPICRVHAALHVPVPDPARLPPAFQVSDFAAEVAEATGGKA